MPTAPMSVARLPKITSHITAPVSMLEMTQPTTSPGIAAGVNTGRIVSLNYAVCKPQQADNIGQHYIDCGDNGSLCDKQDFFVSHIELSFRSFDLSVF